MQMPGMNQTLDAKTIDGERLRLERERTWTAALAVPATLAFIVALGFVLRFAASRAQEFFSDEAFSLLAIRMVAEHGVPILPSGVLYLHGATLSYLMAPVAALGFGEIGDYQLLRLASALAGAATTFMTFRVARFAGAGNAAALLAALFMAVDPSSVVWGGYLRMYALAQTFAVAVAWLFLQAIAEDEKDAPETSRRRTLWALVAFFWLAVFTHLATALLLPAMIAVAVIVFGRELWRDCRDLSLALLGCLLAPIVLILLTGLVGPGGGTALADRSEGLPVVSFLGDDNVNLAQILQPDPTPWTTLFHLGPLSLVAPILVALASGLLIGRYLMTPSHTDDAGIDRRSVGALLALYWLPIAALAFFATNAAQRYALFLLPTGAVLLAITAQSLVLPFVERRRLPWAAAAGAALATVLLIHSAAGLAMTQLRVASKRGTALLAMEIVAARHQTGDLVIATGPIVSSLVMGSTSDLVFLPGAEGSQRVLRYSRLTSDGENIDYWMGIPAIVTTQGLCRTLADNPGSWLVINDHVWEHWGNQDVPNAAMERTAERMRALIAGVADLEYEDAESFVFRSRPPLAWDDDAKTTCEKTGVNVIREARLNVKGKD